MKERGFRFPDMDLAIMVEEGKEARKKGFLEELLLHKKYNPNDPNIDKAIAHERAKIAKRNKPKKSIKNSGNKIAK